MANNADNQRLILELRTKGITLTKSQLKQLDGQVKASKKGMVAMGGAILVATAAVVAIGKTFAHAARVGKAFEQSMANLKAISNASAIQMAKLEKTARNLGATTKFTATEVGGLQTEFAKLGFTVKEIQGATKATLDLAAAVGADLKTAASVAGETVRAFGLLAEDTHEVTDVMALSFSSSALDMDKFTNSMSYVAPVAKMAGFSIKGTTAILGTLANAGISGSMAGTALRRVFLELSNENSKLSERLGGSVSSIDELIPALENLRQEGISTAEMKDLVGQRAISAFSILMDGTETLSDLADEFENAGGAAERMAGIQLDTLEGKLTILNSAWEGFGVALYDHFEEPIARAVVGLTNFLNSWTEVLELPLSDVMKKEQAEINALTGALIHNWDQLQVREQLLDTIKTKYPELLQGIKDEALNVGILKEKMVELNAQYRQEILIQAQKELVNKAIKENTDAIEEQAQKATDLVLAFNKVGEVTGVMFDSNKTYNENLAEQLKVMEENGYNTLTTYEKMVAFVGEAAMGGMGGIGVIGKMFIPKDEVDEFENQMIGMMTQIAQLEKNAEEGIIKKIEYQKVLNQIFADYGLIAEENDSKTGGKDGGGDGGGGDGGSGESEASLATKRQEWFDQRTQNLNTEATQLSFLAELNNKVYTIQADGTKQTHQFTQEEIDLIALKMDAGLEYVDAVREALESVQGVQIFTEEGTEEEYEVMLTKLETIQEYADAAMSILDTITDSEMDRLKKEGDAKIKQINADQKVELAALKKSESYVRASNETKIQMENNLLAAYDLSRAKEQKRINDKIKKQFKVQQLASVANIAMFTAEAVAKNLKESPPTGMPGLAIAIAAGIAQTAEVLSQKPPTMAEGGLIGGSLHSEGGTMINAERGEYVMNRDAVENIGVEELERMNQGGENSISVNITGNVMSDSFVSDEVVPKLQEALRRGGTI